MSVKSLLNKLILIIITFNDYKIGLNSEDTFSDIIMMNESSQSLESKPKHYEIKLIDDMDKLYKVIIDYKGPTKILKNILMLKEMII